MKKSRIIALVLAMTMIISCFASLGTASAAETETANNASTPVIMSYNVAFGSYFYFEAAVNTASVGGEGKLVNVNLYDSADATTPVATAIATYTTENLPEYFGGSAYTVTIPYAISFADTAKEFYIEAECDGAKSAKAKYSIVEYCLQRLYKDAVTGDQKELCQNILNFAASIDKLDKTKENTALDYRYVAVKKDGAVNGTRAAIVVNGNTAKVVANADANVSDWTVTTYAVDGTTRIIEMSAEEAAAGFEVTENMIFAPKTAPIVAAPGTYFEALGGYTYNEFATMAEYNNAKYAYGVSTKGSYFGDNSICSSHVYAQYDNPSPNNGSVRIFMNITADPVNAANKVLRFHKYKEDDTINAVIVGKNMNTEGNTLVFETDFYMPVLPEAAETTLASKNDAQLLQFAFAKTLEAEDRDPLQGWKLDSTSGTWTTWEASIQQTTNSDGSYRYYVTAFRDTTRNPAYVTNLEAATIIPGTWNTLTIELNASGATVYLNGVRCSFCSSLKNTTLTNYDSVFISTRGFLAGANAGFGLYLDNTYLGLINK